MIQELKNKIIKEFNTLSFISEAFPMLTDWGVEDFSLTIHSMGCNYLSALGRSLDFWAMSEYPVRLLKNGSGSIRPDAVWWKKPDRDIILLGEFERFDPSCKNKIVKKAKNLIKAHYEVGETPRLLVLMVWTMAGNDLSFLKSVQKLANDGFRTSHGKLIQGIGSSSMFMVPAAVFGVSNGMHRLQGVYL
jgi:hypothetical protein